jgi:hypothetical protein
MKLTGKMTLVVAFCLIISVGLALAIKTGENRVQIPIGTKIEKKGDVTRFLLQDGVLEVIGLKGELLIRAYDKKGKLIYTGKQGKILSGKTNKETSIIKMREKVAIDDEVTWIKFSPEPAAR